MYVAPHKRNGSAAKHPNSMRTNDASKAPITSSQNHEKHPSQNSIESSPKTATSPVVSAAPTWGKGATFAQIVKQHADIPQKSSLQLKEEVKAASCNVKRPAYSKKNAKLKEDHLVEEDSDCKLYLGNLFLDNSNDLLRVIMYFLRYLVDLKPVTWTNTGREKKGQVSPGETDLQQFDWGEPMVGVKLNVLLHMNG